MKTVVIQNEPLLTEVARLVSEGERVSLRTKGSSMLPFITGGRDSVILVKPETLKVNDIVLARVSTGNIVLHRVVSVEGERLTLMGDGNICGCESCRRADVMAKAVAIVRNDRTVDCTSPAHVFKARVWRMLKPLRRYLLAVYRRITK